jgi:hypothetical protein
MDDATSPPDLDTGFANSEPAGEGASERDTRPSPDAAEDVDAQEATADRQVEASTDSEAHGDGDVAADATADAGSDAGADARNDVEVGTGPRCLATDGGFDFCNAGEHCCANTDRVAACAASCDAPSGFYPVDCPGASGAGGCGSQICCGTLVFDGGAIPNCSASQLTSACSDSCGDNFPGTLASCGGSYTIRLCTAAADCAGDPNGDTYCCNFGNPPSVINWCVASTVALVANSCL